jgi:hypothetical protein
MLRLWILPVLGLIAALGFACGDSGDDDPKSVSSTAPVASASPAPTAASATNVSPNPTVPPGWATYTDPDGRFTLRYPSDWFLQDGAKSSVRPAGALTSIFSTFALGSVGTRFPEGSEKVDLIVWKRIAEPGQDCAVKPDGGVVANLGGVPGWQTVT